MRSPGATCLLASHILRWRSRAIRASLPHDLGPAREWNGIEIYVMEASRTSGAVPMPADPSFERVLAPG